MRRFFSHSSSTPHSRRERARERQRETAAEQPTTPRRQTFQRSRTMTGSSSSQIRSSNELGADLQSPRVKAHRLMRLRRHIGAVLLGVLAVCVLLFLVVGQFTARVAVTIDGDSSIHSEANYSQAVQNYLTQAPIERLRFLVNDTNLTNFLQQKHPEIASAHVSSANGFGSSTVELTMRRPVVQWSVNGAVRYVDASGVPFSINYYADPAVKIVDKSGVRLQKGQTLFSNAFLGFVGKVVGDAKRSEHLTVTKVTIPPRTTRQIEVSIAGVDYPAKLSVDRPAGEQVQDMARAEHWLHTHGVAPRYIDVRVSGEAYYKE